jgi:hypothetical protein
MLSALTQTTEEVMSLLPIALMPQIILSGILQPIESSITQLLSYFTLGRWGTELLARAQDYGQDTTPFLDAIKEFLYPEDIQGFPTDSFEANALALAVVFGIMLLIVILAMLQRISPKNS